MDFNMASLRRAEEEERRRKEEEARRKAEQERARQEAARRAAEQQRLNAQKAQEKKDQQAADTAKAAKAATAPKPTYGTSRQQFVNEQNAYMQAPKRYETKKPEELSYVDYAAAGRRTGGQGQGQKYFDDLSAQMKNPGSGKLYNPYFGTDSTIDEAKQAFGVNRFDSKWIQDNAGLRQYEQRTDFTDTLSKAGSKNWTKEQWAGYLYNQVWMAEERTQQAENQWANLMSDAQDFYKTRQQTTGKAPTADEFMANIDISKYPILEQIDQSRNLGMAGSSKPLEFNRGIGYSRENLYGLYDALSKGKTLDPNHDYFEDSVEYASGVGLPETVIGTQPKSSKTEYNWASKVSSMTPSQIDATREDIGQSGDRREATEFNGQVYKKEHPDYEDYGILAYVDDAYFKKMDPVFMPIINKMKTFDPNGQGTVPKPDKSAPYSEKAAYAYWQRKEWEDATKKAEAEYTKLHQELQSEYSAWKSEVDAGTHDLISGIDWARYPTLEKLMRGTGDIHLNRILYASPEALEGLVKRIKAGDKNFSLNRNYALDFVYDKATPGDVVAGNTVTVGDMQGPAVPQSVRPSKATVAGFTGAVAGALTSAQSASNIASTPVVGASTGIRINPGAVPEKAWGMLKQDGVLMQDEIDGYKDSLPKTDEATGITAGDFKAKASEVDTSKMSKADLLATLKEVNRALDDGKSFDPKDQPNPVVFEHEDQMRLLGEEQIKLLAALKAMGMSDAEIDAALGTQFFNEAGENVTSQITAQQKQIEAEQKQAKITEIRQTLNDMGKNVPVDDPIAMEKYNAEVGGLYAQLAELDAGPTMGAAPKGKQIEVNPPDRLPRGLEDWRTGFLDLLNDGVNALKNPNNDSVFRGNLQNTIAGTFAGKPQTSEAQAAYDKMKSDNTPEAHAAYVDAINKQWTDTASNIGNNLRLWTDTHLPIDTPDVVKDALAYSGTAAFALSERTVAEMNTLSRNNMSMFMDLWMYSNRDKYAADLGRNYTFAEVRAHDPVVNSFATVVDEFSKADTTLRTDYTKQLGEMSMPLLNLYEFSLDMSLMRGLTKFAGNRVASLAQKAVPFIEKLPTAIQTVASWAGKPIGYLLSNSHYMVKSYVSGVDQARQDGANEEDSHQIGIINMFTDGLVESIIGNKYEQFLEMGGNLLRKGLAKSIFGNLKATGKGVMQFVGQLVKMGAGEAMEEITQAAVFGGAEHAIAGINQSWESIPQAAWDWASGNGYDQTKYKGKIVDNMVQNASQAFWNSIGYGIILGAGGRLSTPTQKRAQRILDKIDDGSITQDTILEAAALDAKTAPVPVVAKPDKTPADATLPTAPGKAPSKPQEAPATPAEESIVPEAKAPVEPAAAPVEGKPFPVKQSSAPTKQTLTEASVEPSSVSLQDDLEERSLALLDERDQLMDRLDIVHGNRWKLEGEEAKAAASEEIRLLNRVDAIDRESMAIEREKSQKTALSAKQAPAAEKGPSPEAQMLVQFKNDVEAESEEELIQAEAEARTQQEVDNGAMDDMKQPTHPTYFGILQLDNKLSTLFSKLNAIGQQLSDNAATKWAMIKASVNNMIPLNKGTEKQIMFNVDEETARLLKDQDAMNQKIAEVTDEMKLHQAKYQAEQQQRFAEIQAQKEQEVRDQVDAQKKTFVQRSQEFISWLDDVLKNGWDQLGNGQEQQKKDDPTSQQNMMADKDNEEGDKKTRRGSESLDSKLEQRYNMLDTGAPKGPDGLPMLEVPRRVFESLKARTDELVAAKMGTATQHFKTKQILGAQNSYDLALRQRNIQETPAVQIQKDGQTVESTNLYTGNNRPPVEIDGYEPLNSVTRAWKEGGFNVVGQNASYYIVEDLGYTSKNAELLDQIDQAKQSDSAEDLSYLTDNLSPRYYVVRRDEEMYPGTTNESGFPVSENVFDPPSVAVYATNDMDEALGVIDETKASARPPKTGGTTYYVSRTAMALFNDQYAKLMESDKQAMSYEEYAAMVGGKIDEYAAEHGLSDYERNRMYGAKNLFTKAGKPGWYAIAQDKDYVVFANERSVYDPLVNPGVATPQEAIKALQRAVAQQWNDRTAKRGDGSWATTSYHDEATRNPKGPDTKGKSYTREGTVIYSFTATDPQTGKRSKATAKLGALDSTDAEYGRTFVPTNKILEDAYSIDVNTFVDGHKYNFTIERNYGQAKYGEFEAEADSDETSPEGIVNDLSRKIALYSRMIDDPTIAMSTRQTFLQRLLDAQVKQTDKDRADIADRFKNGAYSVENNTDQIKRYADLGVRKGVLQAMQKAINANVKLGGNEIATQIKSFYDTLRSPDVVDSQITYTGMEKDLAELDGLASAMQLPVDENGNPTTVLPNTGAQNQDVLRYAFSKFEDVAGRISKALADARVNLGGAPLLEEYNRRITELQAKVQETQDSPDLSDTVKEATLATLQSSLKYYTAARFDMMSRQLGVVTTPNIAIENPKEFQYNLAEMSISKLARLRSNILGKLEDATRKATRVANGDRTEMNRYSKLLGDIEVAMRSAPKQPSTSSVRSLASGEIALPGANPAPDLEALVKLRSELFPGRVFDAKPELNPGPKAAPKPAEQIKDASGSRQAALNLMRDIFNVKPEELETWTSKHAGYMLNRLAAEAQETATAYLTAASSYGGLLRAKLRGQEVVDRSSDWQAESGNMPQWLSDAFLEAENILSNMAAGNQFKLTPDPEPQPEPEPPKTKKPTPVSGRYFLSESGAAPKSVHTVIDESDLDETTKAELHQQADETAKALQETITPDLIRDEALGNLSLADFATEAAKTSVGSEVPLVETVSSEQPTLVSESGEQTGVQNTHETMPTFPKGVSDAVQTPRSWMRDMISALVDKVDPNLTKDVGFENPVEADKAAQRPAGADVKARLEKARTMNLSEFNPAPPNDMGDILVLRQVRSRIGIQVSALNSNIKDIDSELNKRELSGNQRDSLTANKGVLIDQRTALKNKSRLISKLLDADEASRLAVYAPAVDEARRYGRDTYLKRVMGSAMTDEEIVSNADAELAKAEQYERDFSITTETAAKVLVGQRGEDHVTANLDVANAITVEAHKAETELEYLRGVIQDTEEQLNTSVGEKRITEMKARLYEMQTMANFMESDIANLHDAASLYYRDSSPGALTALGGYEGVGGRMPTSIGHNLMVLMKAGIRKDPGKIVAGARYVGDVFNRVLETNPERIVKAYLGKYAPVFNGTIIQPIAKSNRFIADDIERYTQMISESGITRENEEIAHLYAEGKISQAELIAARPNDYQQITKGIGVFRTIYQELLRKMNAVLAQNGFPEVPERKNYFPHFKEGANPILALVGLQTNEDTIPLSIVGKTADFRPVKPFFEHALQRNTNETDYGLIKGASGYIPGALQIVHQMNNIVRLRQVEEIIAQSDASDLTPWQQNRLAEFKKYMLDYTNWVSGKKVGLDQMVSRQGLAAMRWLKNHRGLALTLGNTSVIMSQVVSLGMSIGVAPVHTAMAMAEMLRAIKVGDEVFDIHGFEAMSDYMTRKYRGKPIPATAWDNFLEKGQLGAEIVERYVSTVFVRAMYLKGISQGLRPEQAMNQADQIAWRALSSRKRGESGVAYSNVVEGTVLQFAREAMNNVLFMTKDMWKVQGADRKKGIAGIALTLLFNWLFNKVTGKETAFDPVGAIWKTVTNPAENDTGWQTALKSVMAVADTGWPVSYDFTNGAANIPVVSELRNTAGVAWDALQGKLDWSDETTYERIVSAGLGLTPGGGQIERSYRGTKAWTRGYSESNNGDVRFPVAQTPGNLIISTLLGERSTPEGREYTQSNRQPMTRAQDANFRTQVDYGVNTTEAFKNTVDTPKAIRMTNEAQNLLDAGQIQAGKDLAEKATAVRSGITLPTDLPAWAIKLYQDGDPSIRKSIRAWQSSNLTELLPKAIPNAVEKTIDGKKMRVDVTDENRPFYEDQYQRWFLTYMGALGPNPSPKEIQTAIARADAKAKEAFLTKYFSVVLP